MWLTEMRAVRALRLGILPVAIACGLALPAGCGPAYRGEPLYGPLQTGDARVALGQEVFYEHCHQCHPGGSRGLAFAINNKPLPPALVAFQVRNGVGAMPAFSEERIDDDELDALVVYLRALRDHGRDMREASFPKGEVTGEP